MAVMRKMLFAITFLFPLFAGAQPLDSWFEKSATAEAFYQEGRTWHEAGNLEKAAEFYSAALQADSTMADAAYNLAVVHFQSGRMGEAEALLHHLLTMNAADAAALEFYGAVLCRLGNAERAATCFSAALELRPSERLWLQRAAAQARSGNLKAALPDFDEVLRSNAASFEATLGKAQVLAALGQTSLSLNWYEQALSLRPHDAGVQAGYAGALFEAGESEKAMQLFAEALETSPSALVLMARAQCRTAAGDTTGASEDAIEALRLDPENPDFQFYAGEIALAGRRYNEALAYFYKALEIKPERPEARTALLETYRKIDAENLLWMAAKER